MSVLGGEWNGCVVLESRHRDFAVGGGGLL